MNYSTLIKVINETHFGRLLFLGVIVLLLQIPVNSIENLVKERKTTEQHAVEELQQKWGGEQNVIGPLLIIPFQTKSTWQDNETGWQEKTQTKHAVFFPDELSASSQLTIENRYRGIFEVPLYQADVDLSGTFEKPDFSAWNVNADDIQWEKARIIVLVSDARAIQKQATVSWNNKELAFEPGSDIVVGNQPGYHVDIAPIDLDSRRYNFTIQLKLNGSNELFFAPLGKNSSISMAAPWQDPSFQGQWLPAKREINAEGFHSQWQIPYLGRSFPQQTLNYKNHSQNIQNSLVGVNLISPIDNYRMAERSIKYELLFLVLTFALIWMIELLAGLRVHIMQYLFIGAALCLFYLLELSLSEHMGFYGAYVIATGAIVAMVSTYCSVVLVTGKRAAIIGASLTALYLYLFTLLQEQNYALLLGSVGLFAMLAALMYFTRHIDWFKLSQLELVARTEHKQHLNETTGANP